MDERIRCTHPVRLLLLKAKIPSRVFKLEGEEHRMMLARTICVTATADPAIAARARCEPRRMKDTATPLAKSRRRRMVI
jgi:hypothetical protein